jgi:hypothetical protein
MLQEWQGILEVLERVGFMGFFGFVGVGRVRPVNCNNVLRPNGQRRPRLV